MTYARSGQSIPIQLTAGQTLVVKELSGTSSVSGGSAQREAAGFIGAGFVIYGPQSTAATVTLTTTGECDWYVVNGDPQRRDIASLSGDMDQSGNVSTLYTPSGARVGGLPAVSHTLTSAQIAAKNLRLRGMTRTWDKPLRLWGIDATLVRQSIGSNVLQQKYLSGSGVTMQPALNALGQAVMRFTNGSGAQAIVRHKLADLTQKHGVDWRIAVTNVTGTNSKVGLEVNLGSSALTDNMDTWYRLVVEVNPTAGTITARQLQGTTVQQTWNLVTAGFTATNFELGVIKCLSSYSVLIDGVFVGGLAWGNNPNQHSDAADVVGSLYTDLPAGGTVDVLSITSNATPGVGIADLRPVTRRSDGAMVTDATGRVFLTASNRCGSFGPLANGSSANEGFKSVTGVWSYHPDIGVGSLRLEGQIYAWRGDLNYQVGIWQDRPYHASQLMLDDIEGGWIWGGVSHADGPYRMWLGRTSKDLRYGVNRVAVNVVPVPSDVSGNAEDYAFAWDASIGRWRWAMTAMYDNAAHAMWTSDALFGTDIRDFVKIAGLSTGQTWHKLADGWVCMVGERNAAATWRMYLPDGTLLGRGKVYVPPNTPMSGAWPCIVPRNDGVRDRIVWLAFDEAVEISTTLAGLTLSNPTAQALPYDGASPGNLNFGYGNLLDYEG